MTFCFLESETERQENVAEKLGVSGQTVLIWAMGETLEMLIKWAFPALLYGF